MPNNEIGIISTNQALKYLKQDQDVLSRLKGIPLNPVNPIEKVEKPIEPKMTFISPEGQTQQINGAQITPDTIESLQNQKYQIESSESAPEWALMGDLERGRKEIRFNQLKQEANEIIQGIPQSLKNNPEMTNQLSHFNQLLQKRINLLNNY